MSVGKTIVSDYQHHPYHSKPLTPQEEERVRQVAEAPTAEFAKTAEFAVRSASVPDAYLEYIARRRKIQPVVTSGEHFIAHVVLCVIAACLACIPFVGWIPAFVLYWIDAKWCRVSEGTYNGGGAIPVRVV